MQSEIQSMRANETFSDEGRNDSDDKGALRNRKRLLDFIPARDKEREIEREREGGAGEGEAWSDTFAIGNN